MLVFRRTLVMWRKQEEIITRLLRWIWTRTMKVTSLLFFTFFFFVLSLTSFICSLCSVMYLFIHLLYITVFIGCWGEFNPPINVHFGKWFLTFILLCASFKIFTSFCPCIGHISVACFQPLESFLHHTSTLTLMLKRHIHSVFVMQKSRGEQLAIGWQAGASAYRPITNHPPRDNRVTRTPWEWVSMSVRLDLL